MKELATHPTVRRVRERAASGTPGARAGPGHGPEVLDAGWLRRLCLDAGADDAGFVPVDDPDLAAEWEYIDEVLPGIASLIGFVVRTNVDDPPLPRPGDRQPRVPHRVRRGNTSPAPKHT